MLGSVSRETGHTYSDVRRKGKRMDQNSLYGTIKTHSKLGNSEAHLLAKVIWSEVNNYGKFWEKDGKKSGAEAERKKADAEIAKLKEELILKTAKAPLGELTKEAVVAMITESAEQGNAASQKILSEYIGLGKHEEDMVIQMVDFTNAPDWYKTKKSE